jgi:hypothetical protein
VSGNSGLPGQSAPPGMCLTSMAMVIASSLASTIGASTRPTGACRWRRRPRCRGAGAPSRRASAARRIESPAREADAVRQPHLQVAATPLEECPPVRIQSHGGDAPSVRRRGDVRDARRRLGHDSPAGRGHVHLRRAPRPRRTGAAPPRPAPRACSAVGGWRSASAGKVTARCRRRGHPTGRAASCSAPGVRGRASGLLAARSAEASGPRRGELGRLDRGRPVRRRTSAAAPDQEADEHDDDTRRTAAAHRVYAAPAAVRIAGMISRP